MSDHYDADFREEALLGLDEDTELPESFFEELPRPLYWRVLVMPIAPKKVTKSGLVIPISVQEAQQYLNYMGKVVAVGSMAFKDKRLEPETNSPQVGDYVIYGRYAGQTVMYKNIKLLLVNDDELLAVVKNPDVVKITV